MSSTHTSICAPKRNNDLGSHDSSVQYKDKALITKQENYNQVGKQMNKEFNMFLYEIGMSRLGTIKL